MRFLLVDRITELEAGKRAQGVKNVTLSEDFLAYHFPHKPIMPGMLILESLVQLGDWLVRARSDFSQLGLASAFDQIKFRRVVRPGDQLRLQVEVVEATPVTVDFKAQAHCDQALVASARFTLTLYPLETFLDPAEARRLFAILCPGDTGGDHDGRG
jgi:3-hydroxyacyl-[acyl-carrier-protein] dehydratase